MGRNIKRNFFEEFCCIRLFSIYFQSRTVVILLHLLAFCYVLVIVMNGFLVLNLFVFQVGSFIKSGFGVT